MNARRDQRQKLDDPLLDFVIHDEYDGTAGTTENVGERALEEGAGTFGLGDRDPAVSGALVDDFSLLASGLHHHTPTYGVEGIRDDTGDGGDGLQQKKLITLCPDASLKRWNGRHLPEQQPKR